MTDLNDWQLTYPGVVFPFGTFASGFPLTKQVDVGAIETTYADAQHPSTDGRVFGAEQYAGRTLTFEVGIPKVAGVGPRWHDNLDAQGDFAAAWDATVVRRRPGAVAELANLDRRRVVYGRPRNLKPKLDKARQGWSELVCDFATVDHLFYGLDVYATNAELVESMSAGFSTPIVFPWTSNQPTATGLTAGNNGNRDTWPVISIVGPNIDPEVRLLDANGDPMWKLKLAYSLEAGQEAVIDTRPWVRAVTISGQPGSGYLRGTRINECVIPPGEFDVQFIGTAGTGGSQFALSWRDAYAGL